MGRKGVRKTFEAQETVMDPDVEARTSTQVIGADMRFSGYIRKSTGETVIESHGAQIIHGLVYYVKESGLYLMDHKEPLEKF